MKKDTLLLDVIHIDGGTQLRESIDGGYVAELASVPEKDLPPLVVFFDGADHWLADGFHRYHAAQSRGDTAARCIVHTGTKREAQWYSFAANQSHGLRRSNADKHKAVVAALADAEWAKLSDRVLAEHLGVSHEMIRQSRPCDHHKVPPAAKKGPPPARPRPIGGVESESKSTPATATSPAVGGGERLDSAVVPASENRAAILGMEKPKPLETFCVEDEAGRQVTDENVLVDLQRVADFDELRTRTRALSHDIAALAAEPVGHQIRAQQVATDLANVINAIKFATPYTTCPYPERVCKNGCKACHSKRWVTKEVWDRLPNGVKGNE